MISDSSAMARIAANFTLALAVRQNARSAAKASPLWVRPQLHCMRRCLAGSSRASMSEDYHVTFQAGGRRHRARRPARTLGYRGRARILVSVEGTDFDEAEFFRRIGASGARALLIGRRALVALGLPVLTADYDFWVHPEDVDLFNAAASPLGLVPSHTPETARSRGRYVLENDEHVDIIVARFVTTFDGQKVLFDDLWARRVSLSLSQNATLVIPCLDDLIVTKRFGQRPKDLEDIRLLLALREAGDPA